MKEIMTVTEALVKEAKELSDFRNNVKDYLQNYGECYDKFTVTENDTYLGHVSETAIIHYLQNVYSDKLEIHKWSEKFDLDRVRSAVMNNINKPEEILYVREYFYDRYDIEILNKETGKKLLIDVKTAETSKTPQMYWNFLYPVVQNQKDGKDCVILCYYYKQEDANKIILIGYLTEDRISQYNILKAGTKTRFGTINQIDNYETKVKDYKPLSELFK